MHKGQRKPLVNILGYLTTFDILMVFPVAGLSIWLLNLIPNGDGGTMGSGLQQGIVAGATAVIVLFLTGYVRRARYLSLTLAAIRRENPPADDPTKMTWFDEFTTFVQTFDGLTDSQRDDVSQRYHNVWTRGHDKLCDAVDQLAANAGRVGYVEDDIVDAELARLNMIGCGAAPAALAILTRDLISATAFRKLTEPWVSAQMPLPGGDVPVVWHVRLEVCPLSQTPAFWKLDEAANITAETGESAEQLLNGMVRKLYAGERKTTGPGRWRLRIWSGGHDVEGKEPLYPPVWASYQTDFTHALVGRAVGRAVVGDAAEAGR